MKVRVVIMVTVYIFTRVKTDYGPGHWPTIWPIAQLCGLALPV